VEKAMIAGSFVERLILSVSGASDHQWSKWEILTISITVLVGLIWITRQERSKKDRSKYKDHFLELDSSPLIGLKYGAHNKNQHIANDLKRERLAPVHKPQNKQQVKTKGLLKRPHDENKYLQDEISKHEQDKVHLERQVSELTADNEKLQSEPATLEKAELQIAEMTAAHTQLQEEIEQLQNEISQHEQARARLEQQVCELTADNKKLQSELTGSEKAKVQIAEMTAAHRQLQEEIKQLQNEISQHEQTRARFEKQVSELTTDNEKLQSELARLEKAEVQIAEMTDVCRLLQPEETQLEQIYEQQVVAEPAVETQVKRKTAKRSKTSEQQHRTVNGVRQKLCRKCREWKPETEFHKNSSSRDGLANSCKICKNNAARECRRRRKVPQR